MLTPPPRLVMITNPFRDLQRKASTMAKAMWNNVVIAESDNTVMVEGNHYFPRDSVKAEYLTDSSMTTVCPWKGTASYFSLTVDGDVNDDAAWTYPDPKAKAENIRDHVAFWRGVTVTG